MQLGLREEAARRLLRIGSGLERLFLLVGLLVLGLGLGLDERAIEAVRQWKFRAGTMDGKPVSTRAVVEVNFRLL